MKINIRHIKQDDYQIVEELTRDAFWNLYCPGCSEHLIVHQLRKHEDFIPQLSFVIELDGQIVGSIFYSKSKVVSTDGEIFDTITFGPVSIEPSFQNKGLGNMLILHSIEAAKEAGYRGIIIGGYPYHYKKFGFVGTKKYEISMPDGNYYTGIMALPLYDGALNDVKGHVYFSEAMEPDMDALADYDKEFPEKVQAIQPSQAEFEKAVSELDTTDYI